MSLKDLDGFLKLDGMDKIKNVVPKATEALKKIRDIEEAVNNGTQQASQAAQQMMAKAGEAMGGLQQVMSQLQSVMGSQGRSAAAPTIPTGSMSASHEDAAEAVDQALIDLQTMLNTLQTLESAMAAVDKVTAPITAFRYHEEFLARMAIIDDAFNVLSTYDLSVLGVGSITDLLLGINKAVEILAYVPENYIVDYNLHRMVYAVPTIMTDLNFYGIDLGALSVPATTVMTTLRAANPLRIGVSYATTLSRAADILEAKLNQEWTLTPTEQCTYDAVHRFYPEFLTLLQRGNITYTELTDLLKRLQDAISACAATKQLGAPMGSSSAIPQIGSMIDSTLKDFISKGINDQGKVKEAVEKFQKRQQIVQQKKDAADGKFKKGEGQEAKQPEAVKYTDGPFQSSTGLNEDQPNTSLPGTAGFSF